MAPEETSHTQIGQSVGAKLRAARQAKKMTQSQLAHPDFSVSYISAIERGQIHPSLRALEILAVRLGLTSTQLLPRSGEQNDGSVVKRPSPEEEVELALLEAQVAIWQGTSAVAVEQLEKLAKKPMNHRQQLQRGYLLGTAYAALSQLQEAEAILSQTIGQARGENDDYSKLLLLYQLGNTYAVMHNDTQAISSHQSCLKLMEEAGIEDPFLKEQVYFQLGQHHAELNHHERAVEMFECAIALADELTAPEQHKAAYWKLSQRFIDSEDYTLATIYSYKSQFLTNQQSAHLLAGEIYHYLGRALLHGDQEAARAYLMNALQNERVLQDQLARASITTSLAEWFLKQKALREAEEHALQAYELAVTSGDTVVAKEALLTLGRIEYALNRYEEGDSHFIAGLEMLERLGLQEELSDQLARYGQLLEERGLMQEAIKYFKRAFEGQQRIVVHG
ncbi:MAG TPA: helix-turn-helix transcriptional regulator [Ktedonobacteraceae bacterium]|nr:helix-turn-helix transcriptional regulator [Ktedonobacteraceae bacterium]